ncbi:hypothetical protein E4U13_002805 [Claviceps humidiphila]|uniref:PinX1-related protein 1 n=1 Tax=Claviceps humidiphila TaxID=1294629 RepID=A0A9P7Q0J6_9HYPO|nr:hypothetical protein E4U13_002805 [Claviceps humidiphila]
MGLLAENKSRSRINKDPNNTKWTRDTTTFGQKILRAQGWQPGQYLGVQDSAHAELHSAASASYIRVSLKDDMKGLGFNKAKEDQVTGLDVFSDLLSRLNGKSDDAIEGDKQARLEVKTHRYVEAKWGPMRFVRGGLLVGDEMKEVPVPALEEAKKPQHLDEESGKSSKKSKKRKAADLQEDSEGESSPDAKKKEKRRRKDERKLAKKSGGRAEGGQTNDEEGSRLKKKAKKRSKKDEGKSSGTGSEDVEEEEGGEEAVRVDAKKSKKRDKRDKKEKKERKEGKKEKVDLKEKKDKKEKKSQKKRDAAEAEAEAKPTAGLDTKTSTSTSGTSTPTTTGGLVPGSRNFVRSRFIAQKRQAVMDAKALAQIFMVKA